MDLNHLDMVQVSGIDRSEGLINIKSDSFHYIKDVFFNHSKGMMYPSENPFI